MSLQYAGEACRNDREIVLEAVRSSGNCRGAFRRSGLLLRYAGEACRDDREIVLQAVRNAEESVVELSQLQDDDGLYWSNKTLKLLSPDRKRKVDDLFSIWDTEGSGVIERSKLDRITVDLGPIQMSFYRMMTDMDKNNDGLITLDEMIFFDNERHNCVDVASLGVTVAYVPDGVTAAAWHRTLERYPAPGEIVDNRK